MILLVIMMMMMMIYLLFIMSNLFPRKHIFLSLHHILSLGSSLSSLSKMVICCCPILIDVRGDMRSDSLIRYKHATLPA